MRFTDEIAKLIEQALARFRPPAGSILGQLAGTQVAPAASGSPGVVDRDDLVELSDDAPAALGSADAGDADTASRADHVHAHGDLSASGGTMHAAGQVGDLPEAVQDIVGAMVAAGANITATYNDGAGTLTIAVTGALLTSNRSDANPAALGSAAPGTSANVSRADHVHPYPSAANVGAEPALGNPGTDGYVLSSTTAGTRSWAARRPSGTSFPGSPATGDLFYRTDRNLEYFYDGTRWLTTQEYQASMSPQDTPNPYSTAPINAQAFPVRTDRSFYLTRVSVLSNILGTNNGSNYWAFSLRDNAGTTIVSWNTSADAAGATLKESDINAVHSPTQTLRLRVDTKTGAPGNLYINVSLWYRFVG